MAITLTLNKSGATDYTVRDYYGNVVSSGPVAGASFTVTDPVGGLKCGWYRVYLTGPNSDPLFGNSYGAYNFVVVRNNTNFHDSDYTGFWSPYPGGESRDSYLKGVLGIGTSRLSVGNVTNLDPPDPNGVSDTLTTAKNDAIRTQTYMPSDPARPWPLMTNFPNGAGWGRSIGANTNDPFMVFFEKDGTFTPGQVHLATTAGTNSGTWKLSVYYPDSVTLVETIDNLPVGSSNNSAVTINSTSNYVKSFGYNGTYIDTAVCDLVPAPRLGVRTAVSTLYAAGVTYFEGPQNEPGFNPNVGTLGADEVAHRMRMFQSDVHAGNASAKAIGPIAVSLDVANPFWSFGGGAWCDEISMHAYNAVTNGDINLGRTRIETFLSTLASNGLSGVPIWITESTHTFSSVFGVYHPRRSRVPLLITLLMEQYGIPREKNMVWYDRSHGFWSYPSWWLNGDNSVNPYAVLYRVLSEETWGQLHDHRVDFGTPQANCFLLGSVYRSASDDTSTLVIQSMSHVPDLTVDVELEGSVTPPTSLTVVDAWGNESTVSVSSNRATVSVDDIPTYVRLPAGVHARVYQVLDWGASPNPNIAALSAPTLVGTAAKGITDGAFMTTYDGSVQPPGVTAQVTTLPNEVKLLFNGTVAVDRVMIVCGGVWQDLASLIDADVQTTTDGVNWTTRATITVDDATPTFRHGTDSSNAGCYIETFWTEQWVFPVSLGATYNCTGVRLWIRGVSNGGEPSTVDASIQGQGAFNNTIISIQEFMVPSSSTPPTFYGTYPATVLADSPVAYYRLGERSGTSAVDASTTANNGTYGVGCTLGAPGAIGDGDAAYQPGTGVMQANHVAACDVGDTFSIEWWSSGGNPNGYAYVFGKEGDQSAPGIRFIQNKLTLFGASATSSWVICAQAKVATDTNYHHFVITKSGSSVHIWRDGVDITETNSANWTYGAPFTAGSVTFGNPNKKLCVGGENSSNGFNGSFDEFALYNYVLDGTQINNHLLASSTPDGSPVNTVAPSIEGNPAVHAQLSVIAGSWSPVPTYYTYQWQRSTDGGTTWSDITSAANSTLVVPGTDSGHKIKCLVAAGSATGVASAVSSGVVTIS